MAEWYLAQTITLYYIASANRHLFHFQFWHVRVPRLIVINCTFEFKNVYLAQRKYFLFEPHSLLPRKPLTLCTGSQRDSAEAGGEDVCSVHESVCTGTGEWQPERDTWSLHQTSPQMLWVHTRLDFNPQQTAVSLFSGRGRLIRRCG